MELPLSHLRHAQSQVYSPYDLWTHQDSKYHRRQQCGPGHDQHTRSCSPHCQYHGPDSRCTGRGKSSHRQSQCREFRVGRSPTVGSWACPSSRHSPSCRCMLLGRACTSLTRRGSLWRRCRLGCGRSLDCGSRCTSGSSSRSKWEWDIRLVV